MANIATCSFRSRLVKNTANRSGPAGIHRAPGDFSNLSRQKITTRQETLRKHWDYLPEGLVRRANALSTSFKGVPLDARDPSQFALSL